MCRKICWVKRRVLRERRYTVFVDQISPNANAQLVGDVLTVCKSKNIQQYRIATYTVKSKQAVNSLRGITAWPLKRRFVLQNSHTLHNERTNSHNASLVIVAAWPVEDVPHHLPSSIPLFPYL